MMIDGAVATAMATVIGTNPKEAAVVRIRRNEGIMTVTVVTRIAPDTG